MSTYSLRDLRGKLGAVVRAVSVLLQPAQAVTNAEHGFDTDPELRELLERAATSPTVRRTRTRRT